MATEQQSFEGPPRLAVGEGATTPNPGIAGVLIWSTTVGAIMRWDGTEWSSRWPGLGFDAGAWQAPLFTPWNSHLAEWTPPGNEIGRASCRERV